MPNTIREKYDEIETAILSCLMMKGSEDDRVSTTRRYEGTLHETSTSVFCPKKPEYPSSCLALDMTDEDRLFLTRVEDVVVDPITTIGSGLEAAMITEDGGVRWIKVKPVKKPKRGMVAITNKRHKWFTFHFRDYTEGKQDLYIRRPFAITHDGQVPPVKFLGWSGGDMQKDREEHETNLAIMLSIYEDTYRAGAVIAKVKEDVELIFPIGEEAYKDFFILRDGYRNTPTQRLNPIIHWCRKHMRTRGDKTFTVSTHKRGAEEIVIDNMTLSVEYADDYRSKAKKLEANHA